MKSKTTAAIVIAASIIILTVCGASLKHQAISQNSAWEYKIVSQASLAGIKSMEDVWKKAFGENSALSFEGAEKLNAEVADQMNLLGKEGWELVCFDEKSGFIFKRKK
jgi:hypothetical protein